MTSDLSVDELLLRAIDEFNYLEYQSLLLELAIELCDKQNSEEFCKIQVLLESFMIQFKGAVDEFNGFTRGCQRLNLLPAEDKPGAIATK